MSDARLLDVARLAQRAFRDGGVFGRQPAGSDLLTQELVKAGGGSYVALLAGHTNADHGALRGNASRSQALREFPLRLHDGGEAHVCMVLRPLTTSDDAEGTEHAAPFAPGEGLPWVEVREFHLRLFGLAENPLGVRTLRIEYDPRSSKRAAHESWLRGWVDTLGTNPAHSPWHLHINSGDPDTAVGERAEFTDDDLRLALTAPNPLTVVLSLAAWYQRILLRGYGRR